MGGLLPTAEDARASAAPFPTGPALLPARRPRSPWQKWCGVEMARPRFTQAEVTRAAKGAIAAGLSVVRVEIDKDGRVVVYTAAESENSPDEALAEWRRRRGAA